jgi:hypothetical protein
LWARLTLRAGRALQVLRQVNLAVTVGVNLQDSALEAQRGGTAGFTLWPGFALRTSRARVTLGAGRALQVLRQVNLAVTVRVNLQDGAFEAERGGAAGFARWARFTGGSGRPGGAFRAAWAGFALLALATAEQRTDDDHDGNAEQKWRKLAHHQILSPWSI